MNTVRRSDANLNPFLKEMYPQAWGHHFWAVMHISIYCYPENPSVIEQEDMMKFLISITGILPCPGCRGHATTYVREVPPANESRESLMDWVITFHNVVNKSTGKRVLSKDEATVAIDQYFQVSKWTALTHFENARQEDAKAVAESESKIKDAQSTITQLTTVLYIILGTSLLAAMVGGTMLWLRKSRRNSKEFRSPSH